MLNVACKLLDIDIQILHESMNMTTTSIQYECSMLQ